MNRIAWMLVLLPGTAAVALAAQATQRDCRAQTTLVTELGERVRFGMTFPAGAAVQDVPPGASHPGTRYLRVRIEATDANCDWLLTVRDSEYRVIQTLGPRDFSAVPKRWTTRIPGGRAFFDLERCSGSERPQIKFDEYIAMPDEARFPYYSTQGSTPLYRALYSGSHPFRRFGDAVGFLMSSWDRQSWVCSGVMIGRSLFLTNWHCGGPGMIRDALGGWSPFRPDGYWNQQIVSDTIVDLSFDSDQLSREYVATAIEAQSEALDFAILRVAPLDALGDARVVRISAHPPQPGQIVVVHHPEGKQKHISDNCQIDKAEYPGWRGDPAVDFTHVCDTEAGSSGAPVFNLQGELLGLHHLGFDFDRNTCRQTDRVNKAVRIDRIVEFLRQQQPQLWQEIERR